MGTIYRIFDDAIQAVEQAAAAVRAGGLVIFPTETFYGIAADPHSAHAVARLVALKGRDPLKAIPLIARSRLVCTAAAVLSPQLEKLAAEFWPGPLTLVMAPKDASQWPDAILGEHRTVGIRVSALPAARALAGGAGGLITATSANFANMAPAKTFDALDPKLLEQVDIAIDGGKLRGKLPSTVVQEVDQKIRILRAGAVSRQELERIVSVEPQGGV